MSEFNVIYFVYDMLMIIKSVLDQKPQKNLISHLQKQEHESRVLALVQKTGKLCKKCVFKENRSINLFLCTINALREPEM